MSKSSVRGDERATLLAQAARAFASASERTDFLEAVCGAEPHLLADLLETVTQPAPLPASPVALEAAAPGTIISGRFRIVRPLGEGGMADVYEALDLKLGERRALKFSKSGFAHYIPSEARNAMRVTHPNICRIHEIHGGDNSVDFISMEFIEGETLLSRWRREPLPPAEAREIAVQLCRGLQAAHAAHVLHRDLKSNNIMLAQAADSSLRVVILDFGIAVPFDDGDGPPSSIVSGTPNYIAPERWQGQPASPASDVYALGVILYEMLAGCLPFPSGTSWAARLSRLPAPPGASVRKPDPRWDRIVLGCLEPDPARRLSSAAAVLAAIERAFHVRDRRKLLLGAVAAMVLAAAPVVVWRDRIWPPPLARLAILPFTGSTGDKSVDEAVKGGAFQVAAQLESLGAAARRVVVIPVEESIRYEVTTPAAALARLGATHALSGVISSGESGVTLRAAVADAHTGETVREFQGDFRPGDLAQLSTSLAGVVTSAFHLDRAPPARVAPAAYPQYAAGLAALRRNPPDPGKAIAAFEKAAAADAASPLVFGGLAEAYQTRFEITKERRWLEQASLNARRAESLNPDSPPVLLVMGAIENSEGNPERAIELFRRAAQLEPDNSDAWRRIGLAYQRINRDADATAALRKAIQLAPGYYLPHYSLGFVHFRAGRYSEAIDEFRAVTVLAPELASAWASLGGVLVAAEREAEAEPALRQSIQLRETRAALNNLSVLLRYQHRDAEAVGVLQRALKAGSEDAGLRLNLGNALRRVGRSQESRESFQRASELARAALLLDPRDSAARARLAYAMVQLGRPELAADEALQAARMAPTEYSVLFWSVMTMESLGRRAGAFPLLASASYENLRDIRRQPDLADFARDPRFTALLERSASARLRRKEGK